jgi:hypothetical protein
MADAIKISSVLPPGVDPAAPTAQSIFGPNPWLTNPTGSGPVGTFAYNPYYFASPDTAAIVARWVNGTVVAYEALGGPVGNPFTQDQTNQMVRLSNGKNINPGLVAAFFTHGLPLSFIDGMIDNEVAGAGVQEDVELSVAAPPAAPTVPLVLVGGYLPGGATAEWAAGPDAICGPQGGLGAKSNLDQQVPVNMWTGLKIQDPKLGWLIATVVYNSLFRTYRGSWAPTTA